jgi:zinc transport system permease protein
MFQYKFMIVAFIVGALLGVIIPLVGSTAVYKRLSNTGDALAHTSLSGVAIGLVAGLNPLITSVIMCVISIIIIEFIRKKFSKYAEMGVAVVLSAGIGVAGILTSFTNVSNFDSYLFGSILLIDDLELYLVIALFVVVVLFYVLFDKQILATIYNEEEAKVQGIKVNLINFTQSILLALTIALSAKTIGSLIVSSLIVLPVATALQLKQSYKITMLSSLVISLVSTLVGITCSYYLNVKPGATIIIVSVIQLLIFLCIKPIITYAQKRKSLA